MNNQSTIDTFAEWYRNQQPVLAAQPVPISIDYQSSHCFLVMIPDMPQDERMKLATYILEDQAELFEQEFSPHE